MENFAFGDQGFKSGSSGWICMYTLKSSTGEEKWSWRLQQKCPVQVSWAVVPFGGHHAYRGTEVMGGVNGALVCDYLMLTVFAVYSLVELPFWYSWLALQPEEECAFHVHCSVLLQWGLARTKQWLLGLPQKKFPSCYYVSRKLVWLVLLFSSLVRRESCVSAPCWAWLALCSVGLGGSCGQTHITWVGEEALTTGFGGQTWETHPTSATTALFCSAQSQLGGHQFLSVKLEILQVLAETV